jgi:hypothetical protein
MHKVKNLINLSLQEKLKTMRGLGFMNKMDVEHLKFITNRVEGGIVP